MEHANDLIFEGHGTLVLVHPVSDRGLAWLAERCPEGEAHTYLGNALVVEHRFADGLAGGAVADGLLVL